jgi:hypothetical protein
VIIRLERTNRLELQPGVQAVHGMVERVARGLVLCTQAAGRVALQLTERQCRELQVGRPGPSSGPGPSPGRLHGFGLPLASPGT